MDVIHIRDLELKVRVEFTGLDLLDGFLRTTQILNVGNALSIIGIEMKKNDVWKIRFHHLW
jgi:hypothetical protein